MPLTEQILHIAEAQMDAEIEPDSVGDHLGWEGMATVERLGVGAAAGHRPSLPAQLDDPLYAAAVANGLVAEDGSTRAVVPADFCTRYLDVERGALRNGRCGEPAFAL